MMLFDTHCHLTEPDLALRLPEILAQSRADQVAYWLSCATDRATFAPLLHLKQQYPHVFIALGVHPFFVAQASADDWSYLQQCLAVDQHIAVGEIGLDFYDRTLTDAAKNRQIEAFMHQLQLAEQWQRPIVLHQRHAFDACVHSMRQASFSHGGFAHAFSGSLQQAQQLITLGFKIGIGSVLLNPKAVKIRRLVAQLPLTDMVLETDAPFMPPPNSATAYNHPRHTLAVARAVADIQGVALAEVMGQTTRNALALLHRQTPA